MVILVVVLRIVVLGRRGILVRIGGFRLIIGRILWIGIIRVVIRRIAAIRVAISIWITIIGIAIVRIS